MIINNIPGQHIDNQPTIYLNKEYVCMVYLKLIFGLSLALYQVSSAVKATA